MDFDCKAKSIFYRYGKHLMKNHRYAEARKILAEALNIYVEVHGRDDPEVVDLLNNLAAACLQVCYFAKPFRNPRIISKC